MISVTFTVDRQDALASASACDSKSLTVRKAGVCSLCFTVLALMAFCVSCNRAAADKEIGTNGLVIMTDAKPSDFAEQYRDAANFLKQNNVAQAAQIYTNLIEREPASPDPYVGLASCEMQRGSPTVARKLYEKAFQNDSKCASALIGIGSSYDRELDFTNALAFFRKALAIDANSAQAHYGLTRVYSEIGDSTNARIHLEQFKKLSPESRYLKQMEYYIDRWPRGTNSPMPTPQN